MLDQEQIDNWKDNAMKMNDSVPVNEKAFDPFDWSHIPDAGCRGISPVTEHELLKEFSMLEQVDVAAVTGLAAHEVLCDLEAEAARMGEGILD